MEYAVIQVSGGLPDYCDIHYMTHDWQNLVYVDAHDLIPINILYVIWAPFIMTHYVGTILYHGIITGRLVTGIVHFINEYSFSKKQIPVRQLHTVLNL